MTSTQMDCMLQSKDMSGWVECQSHKKEWNLDICNKMDGPRGYYAKWDMSDGERQILCDFPCMWNLKNKWMNIAKQGQRYRYGEQGGGRQREGAWGEEWGRRGGWGRQTFSCRINESRVWNVRNGEYRP